MKGIAQANSTYLTMFICQMQHLISMFFGQMQHLKSILSLFDNFGEMTILGVIVLYGELIEKNVYRFKIAG